MEVGGDWLLVNAAWVQPILHGFMSKNHNVKVVEYGMDLRLRAHFWSTVEPY